MADIQRIFVLDKKTVGLFPQEKLIAKSLQSAARDVKSIYSLVPRRFWVFKSIYYFIFLVPSTISVLLRRPLSSLILDLILMFRRTPPNTHRLLSETYNLSLFDSVNKRESHVLFWPCRGFFLKNIRWTLRYSGFCAIDTALLFFRSLSLLRLSKSLLIIGDIFYNTETLITILTLLPTGEKNTRSNVLCMLSGIFGSSIYNLNDVRLLRAASGPYGSSFQSRVIKRSNSSFVLTDDSNYTYSSEWQFSGFVLYPPCISDSFNFALPSIYTSQVEWAEDLFQSFSNAALAIKMHPMADDYNDKDFWQELFDHLSSRYNVNVTYIDSALSLDDVLMMGYYPLSPKGTVGLELICRGFPSPLLGSNSWTHLFQDLQISSRKEYVKVISCASNSMTISTLSRYAPTSHQISIAKSVLNEETATGFFEQLQISPHGKIPGVKAGSKSRLNNKSLDIRYEKDILDIYDSDFNSKSILSQFNSALEDINYTP